jgi:hypothetical protein
MPPFVRNLAATLRLHRARDSGGPVPAAWAERSKLVVQVAATATTADHGRRWFSSRTEEVAVDARHYLRIDWRALLAWTVVIAAISTLTILAGGR